MYHLHRLAESQGDAATFALPAVIQRPLFSMLAAASSKNERFNVRVNEVYLMLRVEVDEGAAQHDISNSSEFAAIHESILANPEIRSSRVRVEMPADFKNLKPARKF